MSIFYKKASFSFACGLFLLLSCTQEKPCIEKNASGKNNITIKVEIPQKISFPSLDGLPIHAHLYELDSNNQNNTMIVLCHQAGWNKMEYVKSAVRLMEAGYACLAIDQRAGNRMMEWFNETHLEAIQAGKSIDYIDAEQDIEAAVRYVDKKYKKRVILIGSSYSATLALAIAGRMKAVKAVLAFSPGNYFAEKNSRLGLKNMLDRLKNKPFWITSSKKEANELKSFAHTFLSSELQQQFIPKGLGQHGARALWETDPNHEEYWVAMLEFLNQLSTHSWKKMSIE